MGFLAERHPPEKTEGLAAEEAKMEGEDNYV
jgi:hypothetical protein